MGMIGKRKGKVVKGAGSPGAGGDDNVGGSLSKNDHWYLQQGFGFGGQPGAAPIPATGHTASGGIISDLSSFTSSLIKRGVKFINIPTTLLAQADASIGGKTGINSSQGKNLIGTFYQPDFVLFVL